MPGSTSQYLVFFSEQMDVLLEEASEVGSPGMVRGESLMRLQYWVFFTMITIPPTWFEGQELSSQFVHNWSFFSFCTTRGRDSICTEETVTNSSMQQINTAVSGYQPITYRFTETLYLFYDYMLQVGEVTYDIKFPWTQLFGNTTDIRDHPQSNCSLSSCQGYIYVYDTKYTFTF